jgi:putative membrane protein
MFMRSYIFLLLIPLLLAVAACENEDNTGPAVIGELDRQFILAAADDALFQVNAGQVAASGTTQKNIRDYGEQMTTDYTQAGQELQKLAATKRVEIPTTLSDERQQQLDSLAMQTGAGLDTLYLNQMVAVQERVVHMMEIEGTSGNDFQLKQWASDRLPKVRQFEERAKAMRDSLN